MKLVKQEEKWFDIKGYEGLYQISAGLEFRRLPSIVKRGNYLMRVKGGKMSVWICSGYPRIGFYKNGIYKTFMVHILVGLHFVKGRTKERNQINHKNGNSVYV